MRERIRFLGYTLKATASWLRGMIVAVGVLDVILSVVVLALPGIALLTLAVVLAFAPDVGEVLGQFKPGPGLANLYPVVYPNGFGIFAFINQQKFRESFCADVDPRQAEIMAVVQKPGNFNLLSDPTMAVAWKAIPSWYLISGKDQPIPPSVQQFFAGRMNATTITVEDSSHASIVSHPDEVLELIQAASGQDD